MATACNDILLHKICSKSNCSQASNKKNKKLENFGLYVLPFNKRIHILIENILKSKSESEQHNNLNTDSHYDNY